MMPPPGPVRFAAFTFDRATRQVTRDGVAVHLTPKAFELLSRLIAEAPRVVPKEELHRHIWPDSFVSEASLLGLVKEVRHALGDDGRGDLIRTAHRVGYAFTAPLQRIAAPGASVWVMAGAVCVPLQPGENLIGRDVECTVRIDLPNVSRRHARIVVTGDGATIEDLASRNGTLVGGRTIDGPTVLREADRIRIGDATLTFHVSPTSFQKETLPIPGAPA